MENFFWIALSMKHSISILFLAKPNLPFIITIQAMISYYLVGQYLWFLSTFNLLCKRTSSLYIFWVTPCTIFHNFWYLAQPLFYRENLSLHFWYAFALIKPVEFAPTVFSTHSSIALSLESIYFLYSKYCENKKLITNTRAEILIIV